MWPDAIALSDNENVVIEVKRSKEQVSPLIAALFQGQRKWKFQLVSIGDVDDERETVGLAERASIGDELVEANDLLVAGHSRAAFSIAWGAFEAAARLFEEGPNHRIKPASRVIEYLERTGVIGSETGHDLRTLLRTRNEVMHGDLNSQIEPQVVQRLIGHVRSIIELP